MTLTAAAVSPTWVGAPQTPQTRGGYILSTAEQFVGLLLSALLLGMVVTKASVPSAKLVFSKARALGRAAARPPPGAPRPPQALHVQGRARARSGGGGPRAGRRARRRAQVMVMSRRNGRWVLTCRIGNARGNFLYNPEIRLAYLFPTTTGEGERLWAARARARPAAPVPPAMLGPAPLPRRACAAPRPGLSGSMPGARPCVGGRASAARRGRASPGPPTGGRAPRSAGAPRKQGIE